MITAVQGELAQTAAGLEAASNAAMHSLGLAPDEFAWFSGEMRHSMAAMAVETPAGLPVGEPDPDYFSSRATFYGGRTVNQAGHFACGHIRAYIAEHIPEGAIHQSGGYEGPVPYVPRLLTARDGIITVDTPTMTPSANDGPVVTERLGGNRRFRKSTVYNTETGQISVKSGELVSNGSICPEDLTIEQDAFELPEDILLLRLATLIRTIGATSGMFEHIAWRNVGKVTWRIVDIPRM